jgi:hypothetical protein
VGCLAIGLATFIFVIIGIFLGLYFGTRKAIQYAVENYTTNAPIEIPELQIASTEQKQITRTLQQNAQRIISSQGPREIVLSEQDLNVLIAQSPDLQKYKKQIYLKPDGDQLRAFLSLPLDQFEPWKKFSKKMAGDKWGGRYLNGMAILNLSVTNGVLQVVPKKVVVRATTLPDDFINRFPWSALTDQANRSPDVKAVLEKIDRIETRDSKLHIHFKP